MQIIVENDLVDFYSDLHTKKSATLVEKFETISEAKNSSQEKKNRREEQR